MMFQQTQVQMRALQSQVQLLQQIGLPPTSADPVCSSRSIIHSTSQSTHPVTTVQSNSEQHNSASLSSSQVCTATYDGSFPLTVLYIHILSECIVS